MAALRTPPALAICVLLGLSAMAVRADVITHTRTSMIQGLSEGDAHHPGGVILMHTPTLPSPDFDWAALMRTHVIPLRDAPEGTDQPAVASAAFPATRDFEPTDPSNVFATDGVEWNAAPPAVRGPGPADASVERPTDGPDLLALALTPEPGTIALPLLAVAGLRHRRR